MMGRCLSSESTDFAVVGGGCCWNPPRTCTLGGGRILRGGLVDSSPFMESAVGITTDGGARSLRSVLGGAAGCCFCCCFFFIFAFFLAEVVAGMARGAPASSPCASRKIELIPPKARAQEVQQDGRAVRAGFWMELHTESEVFPVLHGLDGMI